MVGPFFARPNIILEWLRAKGYTGTVNDGLRAYFKTLTGLASNNLYDLIEFQLSMLGYTGTLDDKLSAFFSTSTGVRHRRDAEAAFFSSTATTFESTVLGSLLSIPGLIFYNNYDVVKASLDAEYAGGVATATYTATRNTGFPGTYVDANGVIQTQSTTNNTQRFTYGNYNENGFVSAVGYIIEEARTNLLTYSYTYENAAWTPTNITPSDGAGASPDGNTNAASLTATASDGTILHSAVTAKAYSVFLKRKTGTGPIYITANGGTTWKPVTLLSGWARFQVFASSASQTCGIKIATSGDAVYAWVSQFEAADYASTPIITTSSSLARNAESLSYSSTGNRNASAETQVAKIIPFGAHFGNALSTVRPVTTTTTKLREFGGDAFLDGGWVAIAPNYTDNSTKIAFSRNIPRSETSSVIAGSCDQVAGTYAAYYFGTDKGSGSGSWTENAWGATFKIGTMNGIVQNIAIYNRKLTDAEVLTVSGIIEEASANSMNYPDYLIGALGDSITYGAGSSDGFGYRSQLQLNILAGLVDRQETSRINMVGDQNDASDSSYFPRHGGVSGQSISQISSRLDAILADYFYPASNTDMRGRQIFLIHAGTNDVTAVGAGSYTTTLANYSALLDKIYNYNPNIEIYCALLIPRIGANEANNITFNDLLNTALTTYQATHPNVHIVDMHTAFTDNPTWDVDYMSDTLHPNNAGYVVMGDTWTTAINA